MEVINEYKSNPIELSNLFGSIEYLLLKNLIKYKVTFGSLFI